AVRMLRRVQSVLDCGDAHDAVYSFPTRRSSDLEYGLSSATWGRLWSHDFLTWYNQEHHHSGLALLTPADVHYGRAAEKLAQRQLTLQQAYAAHPERFVQGQPLPASLPDAVWINQPASPTSLAEPEGSPILTTAGTEDRATLESDPSAAV